MERMPWDCIRKDIESTVLLDGLRPFPNALSTSADVWNPLPFQTQSLLSERSVHSCRRLEAVISQTRSSHWEQCILWVQYFLDQDPKVGCLLQMESDVSESPNFVAADELLMDREMTQLIRCYPQSQATAPSQHSGHYQPRSVLR